MRYRKLDADGDYTFGGGRADFFVDSPEAVGQAVLTRLQLFKGEWFVDTSDGTPWQTEVLGENTRATYDMAIRNRILGTQGVEQIDNYDSEFEPNGRKLKITCTITTAYGQTTISETL
ncbi:hypothetical protein [Pseudomonas aeruginosa]|uniref:hypothetical protein n=1 Tax=Pseudomonas aeruginosa TaxID=287 RepID=UPI001495BF26|nr:hypothetical protein [Pseudomonas aeruginosa]NPS37573.1 hypothetical protein [Pseudomonas aeruginosa]NPS87292.1 hypothetical protein [Pseudomonas aeruginosa]